MTIIVIINISLIYFYIDNLLMRVGQDRKNSLFYFPVYLFTLTIHTILYNRYGYNLEFIFLMLVSTLLILIMFGDLLEMLIPDGLILSIIGTTIIYHIANYIIAHIIPDVFFHLSGLLVGSSIFIIIILASKGGMGQGDATLISSLGLILGPNLILLNIILSFLLGSVISVFLLLTRIKSRKDPIPFGPFIIIAFFISILYGDEITNWYINLIKI